MCNFVPSNLRCTMTTFFSKDSRPSETLATVGERNISVFKTMYLHVIIALFYQASNLNNTRISLGKCAISLGKCATFLGKCATFLGNYATSLGNYATFFGNYTTSLGNFSTFFGNFSTFLGKYAISLRNYSAKIRKCTPISQSFSRSQREMIFISIDFQFNLINNSTNSIYSLKI